MRSRRRSQVPDRELVHDAIKRWAQERLQPADVTPPPMSLRVPAHNALQDLKEYLRTHTSSSRDIARMIQVVAQVLPAVDAPFEFGVKTDLLLERTAENAVYQEWDSNGSRCWVDLRVMPDVEH